MQRERISGKCDQKANIFPRPWPWYKWIYLIHAKQKCHSIHSPMLNENVIFVILRRIRQTTNLRGFLWKDGEINVLRTGRKEYMVVEYSSTFYSLIRSLGFIKKSLITATLSCNGFELKHDSSFSLCCQVPTIKMEMTCIRQVV